MSKTIFVLEPDNILCRNYARVLQKPDRKIITFRTAGLAIKALEKVMPDIVVLEIAMPAHNGFEFLYEMFSYSDTRNIKVVVNSLIQPDSLPWGFINRDEFNIVDHLYKPFSSLDELSRVVAAACEAND